MRLRKLGIGDIYRESNLDSFNIDSTLDIPPLVGDLVRQDRAKEAIDFGLSIQRYGYNIFCSGPSSAKKTEYLKEVLGKRAKGKAVPEDLCYIHNFEEPASPLLVKVPPGKGREWREDMRKFILTLKSELPVIFTTAAYKKSLEILSQKHDQGYSILIDRYDDKLKELSYSFCEIDSKLYPLPVRNGEFIKEEDLNSLPEEEMGKYLESKERVDLLMVDFIHEQSEIEEGKLLSMETQDKTISEKKVEELISPLKLKYEPVHPRMKRFLEGVKESVLSNIDLFRSRPKVLYIEGQPTPLAPVNPSSTDFLSLYEVNLIVDNSHLTAAPVVFSNESDETKIFGAITFDAEKGHLFSSYHQIRAGDILRANGGYFIISARDLFKCPMAWERLKQVLRAGTLKLSSRGHRDALMADSLAPEEIPVDVKVVLIGDIYIYSHLSHLDPEFGELFKIHAIFDYATDRTLENEYEYAQMISAYCKERDCLPLEKDAICSVLEYSARLVGRKDKLSLNFSKIYNIISEAEAVAKNAGASFIGRAHVEGAAWKQVQRGDIFSADEKQDIEDGVSILDVDGYLAGEVNALTVYGWGDFRRGFVVKVTASVFAGSEGVVSVDRNTDLTGAIYDKANEIIRGFLGATLAKERPLSLTANISFEQCYNGIDGDSATVAEVISILSDITGIPVAQHLAITGSMNQKGRVQPVGGVNEKIEGFFTVCRVKGLTGHQGVVIPSSNVRDLMLSSEVSSAVEKGLFSIYVVSDIKEAIKLLLGKSYEEVVENAKFKAGVIAEKSRRTCGTL